MLIINKNFGSLLERKYKKYDILNVCKNFAKNIILLKCLYTYTASVPICSNWTAESF